MKYTLHPHPPIWRENNTPRYFALLAGVISLWTLMLALWIYLYSIRHGGIPTWDGFERLAWIAEIWYDFRHGDWLHLWRHTNSQVIWPFLHSWITAILFVLFGPSIAVSRLVSLLAFTGSSLLILRKFFRLQSPSTWVGGTVAWSLFTTSPIVIANTANIMSEMLGFFLIFGLLTILPISENSRKTGRYVVGGILLSLLFFYKYNFSVLTFTGLLLARFAQGHYSIRKMFSKENSILFGIPIVAVGLWFLPFSAFKLENFWGFVTNNPDARTPLGWDFWLYYPRVIPSAYYSIPLLFPLSIGIVVFAAIVSPRMRLSNPLLACFLIHCLAAIVHPMKMERFQFIPLGLFFVMTGESIEIVFSRYIISLTRKEWTRVSITVCTLILIPVILTQSHLYREPQTAQGDTTLAPLQAVLDRVQVDDRIALLISHDLVCTPSITYYYITHQDRLTRDLRTLDDYWHLIFLYQSKEEILAMPVEERIEKLRQVLKFHRSNKLVILESMKPERISYFEKVYGGTQEIANLVSVLPEFALLYERQYAKSFTRLRMYSIEEQTVAEKP